MPYLSNCCYISFSLTKYFSPGFCQIFSIRFLKFVKKKLALDSHHNLCSISSLDPTNSNELTLYSRYGFFSTRLRLAFIEFGKFTYVMIRCLKYIDTLCILCFIVFLKVFMILLQRLKVYLKFIAFTNEILILLFARIKTFSTSMSLVTVKFS